MLKCLCAVSEKPATCFVGLGFSLDFLQLNKFRHLTLLFFTGSVGVMCQQTLPINVF